MTLSLLPDADPAACEAEIPPLKYNKSLLVLLTQDDCKQSAFSTTWAAIHGRPLSDTYFYNAAHLRGGDLPPDLWALGKTLASTDGTGRDVRFSFTTTLSPEWSYMEAEAEVKPGFMADFYRFYMKAGLLWNDVREMVNYGVGIALHDMNTRDTDKVDTLVAHYRIAQTLIQARLSGRGCKMLVEPNGNKTYVEAAMCYDPVGGILVQSGGVELRPFAVRDDLWKQPLERTFPDPRNLPEIIEAQMRLPAAERRAVNIGVHGTDRPWAEFLLWLNDHYGRDGEDCVWMPSAEEYFEYISLRSHAVVTRIADGNKVRFRIHIPGGMYFYHPSLTINIPGLALSDCLAVEADEAVTGLSFGAYDGGVMVNIDCRRALAAHAEHFVEQYEASPSPANKADALYFVGMLRDSELKKKLLERSK